MSECIATIEQYRHMPYKDWAKETYGKLRIWDYLQYDKEGFLWLNGDIRLIDVVQNSASGTPIELVDPSISTRRGKEWKHMTRRIAAEVGYPGGLEYYYATKASPTAEIVSAALNALWHIETSSEQDVTNLLWMHENGFLPRGLRVYANGYKPHPEKFFRVDREEHTSKSKLLFLGEIRDPETVRGQTYVEKLMKLKRQGVDVTPIIDSPDELSWLADGNITPDISVGVRFKAYGLAHEGATLDNLVSRHGMTKETIFALAAEIQKQPHLHLTTFHAMIGAAETIPVETFVEKILATADVYFQLKKRFPSLPLSRFNMGGGMPPLGQQYDHEGFMRNILQGILHLSKKYGIPAPTFECEYGSFLAAESGMALLGVLNRKVNSQEKDGTTVPWLVTNYSLMRGLIDMKLIGQRYIMLPIHYANKPGAYFRFGDMTCDSDGKFLTDASVHNAVFLPNVPAQADGSSDLVVAVIGMGAYEEFLTGLGGVGHSGQFEPRDFVVIRRNGIVELHGQYHQNQNDARITMGYEKGIVAGLRHR